MPKLTTEGALIRRINRRLPEYHKLHKSRGTKQYYQLGNYYVIDHYRNTLVAYRIDDLGKFLAECDSNHH